MKLSVIIVNYNVKFFIEQCLLSVEKAIFYAEQTFSVKNIVEVFVVDNNSVDGSVEMLKQKFSHFKLIFNHDNPGFAKANNQAIKQAEGEYILLLNPDTLIEEDTFSKCISFMDSHPDAGALGVKMIDGNGNFLPESKRALPTPAVAFYKIFGLSGVFPKSKKFGKYYLSYLDENQTHEIEILAGAFMFIRQKALEKCGLLDEVFFMYGEDIDLSYRILKADYKNYYFPETKIIHYKGESTKKGSLNYVFVFYKAMIIFAKKHFSKKFTFWFSLAIHLAIYFRASLAALKRLFFKITLPIFDFIFAFSSFLLGKEFWEYWRWGNENYYSKEFVFIHLPVYSIIILLFLWIKKAYRIPFKLKDLFSGILLGGIFLITFYSLLDESKRFSRAVLLLGILGSLVVVPLGRYLLSWIFKHKFQFYSDKRKKIILIGGEIEIKEVEKSLQQNIEKFSIIGYISNSFKDTRVFGRLEQMKEIITIHRPDELIFCAGEIKSSEIIQIMHNNAGDKVEFKIALPNSLAIIGSHSIHSEGKYYTRDLDFLSKKENLRRKRTFDLSFSLLLLPFALFVSIIPSYSNMLRLLLSVILNKKTWIGFSDDDTELRALFPYLKQGVLQPYSKTDIKPNREEKKFFFIQYTKKYQIRTDLFIIFRAFKKIKLN